jgi:hypothetical protein
MKPGNSAQPAGPGRRHPDALLEKRVRIERDLVGLVKRWLDESTYAAAFFVFAAVASAIIVAALYWALR